MARFLRLLLALVALPFSFAVGRAFFACLFGCVFSSVHMLEGLSFCGGVVAFALLVFFLPAPVRVYVLGHELTHALWGLLFGARISRLKVGANGGSVMLSKSNVWITLAPYFFPFYTFLVVLAAIPVQLYLHHLPMPGLWLFALGFTWSFHVTLTLKALGQTQPDVQEYGRLFSWSFIWIANVLIVMIALVAATPLTAADAFAYTASATRSAYGMVADGAYLLYHLVAPR